MQRRCVDEPIIAASALTSEALSRRFAVDRPWSPDPLVRALLSRRDEQLTDRPAAVLVALMANPSGSLDLLLTRRNMALSRHAGQIALPGGCIDPTDVDARAAALRETEEEVGIDRRYVHILGELPQLRTGTGYLITPVVGLVDPSVQAAALIPEAAEVSEIFLVPLTFLMNPRHHELRCHMWEEAGQRHERQFYSMTWVPAGAATEGQISPAGDYFIWGVTAAIVRNLYRSLCPV